MDEYWTKASQARNNWVQIALLPEKNLVGVAEA